MDSDKQKPEAERHPAQNELDLEFNQMEPITPKKPFHPEPSLLDKAKALFAQKEKSTPQFHARKEPTLGASQPSVSPQPDAPHTTPATDADAPHHLADASGVTENQATPPQTSPSENTPINNTDVSKDATAIPEEPLKPTLQDHSDQTSVTASASAQPRWKHPESWAILQVLPQRHRRIVVVLFIIIFVLLLFFWLKPSTDTVQSFEQQNSNAVPIQFQPLDKSQETEATVLDNLTHPQDRNPTAQSTSENLAPIAQQPTQETRSISLPNTAQNTIPVNTPAQENAPVSEKPQPVETVKTVHKKAPTPEKAPVVEKAKATEPVKVKEKAKVVDAPPVKVEKKAAPVVDAQPSKANMKNKTLTIPQGVSLMQVFRDHQLNIADVNAMTKAQGVGNALSRFKGGDKVQVSINAQGRVAELRLENGARFIRQADGSYQYKK